MNTNYKHVAPSTKLLLYDGREIEASQLKIGDILLSTEWNEQRRITNITTYKSQNYMFISRYCNSPFIINENHYLPVVLDNNYVLVNVKVYLSITNKSNIFLIRQPVDLKHTPISIEPYLLGIWFSNCDRNDQVLLFPKSNVTIILFLISFVEKFDLEYEDMEDDIIITDNRVVSHFEKYGLFEDYSMIPDFIKYNNVITRQRFLAGFIDNNNTPEITITNKQMKDDICYIAHSLGLLTSTKTRNKIWYITILYNNSQIITNDFKVAKIPNDDCICLEITGTSPGILLADFTVI